MICSGGFAESGGDGIARQNAIEEILAQASIRLLGPNTAGYINLSTDRSEERRVGQECT